MKHTYDTSAESGIYAPGYYNKFKCIAQKCRHNCCLDWGIYIDDATYAKYKGIEDIMDTVKVSEDGYYFELCKNGRCPHLNDEGLCKIILSYGESYLSEICTNHPRFFNDVGGRRAEIGLGIVCEEACRLILEDDEQFSLVKIEESDGYELQDMGEFDALPERLKIISLMEDRDMSYNEKIDALKLQYGISMLCTFDKWVECLLSFEILDEAWERDLRRLQGMLDKTDAEKFAKYDKYYERLLKYFIYRHLSVADCVENFCARLAFAILSTEIIRRLFEADSEDERICEGAPEKLIDWARRYSAEIEYSDINADALIFAFESGMA